MRETVKRNIERPHILCTTSATFSKFVGIRRDHFSLSYRHVRVSRLIPRGGILNCRVNGNNV